jgi:hypothetical protein
MSGPLIFITTARVKDGKLDDFKRFITQLFEHVQAREPDPIAFNVYLNEDGTEMTSIQVHPGAASMDSHLQLMPKLLGEDMTEWVNRADFLEIKHIEIYGTPSAALLEADQQWVDSGAFSRTVKPVHVTGFTRTSVDAS